MATQSWTILGAGAVGHLLACRFALQQIPVGLIYRNEPENKQSLVEYRFNESTSLCAINYQSIDHIQSIECLVLAVKSYQVEDAISSIRGALTASSQIFLLQNGMGNLERVTQLLANSLDPKQIYPGVNNHGVYLSKNNRGMIEVVHAGEGNIVFGSNYLCSEPSTLPDCLNSLIKLDLNTSWAADIESRLWLKVAVNGAINPLTSIHHCLNGRLVESKILRRQVELLCAETAELFRVLNVKITKNDIINEVFSVIDKTANNYSSMLQDTNSGKNTEIEAITGYLLEKAKLHNLELKTHQALYQTIVSPLINPITPS